MARFTPIFRLFLFVVCVCIVPILWVHSFHRLYIWPIHSSIPLFSAIYLVQFICVRRFFVVAIRFNVKILSPSVSRAHFGCGTRYFTRACRFIRRTDIFSCSLLCFRFFSISDIFGWCAHFFFGRRASSYGSRLALRSIRYKKGSFLLRQVVVKWHLVVCTASKHRRNRSFGSSCRRQCNCCPVYEQRSASV